MMGIKGDAGRFETGPIVRRLFWLAVGIGNITPRYTVPLRPFLVSDRK